MIKTEHKDRINEIIHYIQKNLDSTLTTESLAGIAFLSKSHFKKLFKEISGENISDYVKRSRLEKAHFMLLHNQHRSITDIALATGFSSSASFARAFKQNFGISASDLRKDNENESIINFGIPFMRNYEPEEYEGPDTIYSITDNLQGTYYFGSEFGEIYIYNNNNFIKLKLQGLDAVLAMTYGKEGILWIGSVNDFGFVDLMKQPYTFVSLRHYLPDNEPDFNQVWKILETPHGVYFQSRPAVFRWNDNKITILRTNRAFHSPTYINGKLYLMDYKMGILLVKGSKFEIIETAARQIDQEHLIICNLLPYDENYLFCLTRNRGCWLFDGQFFIPMQTEIDHIIDEAGLLRAVHIPHIGYAIGTRTMGIIIIDRDGNIFSIINRKRGLIDNYIRSIHYSADSTLLIGMLFGISMLNVGLPVMIYNENTGIKNMISSICRYRGLLYMATQYGISRETCNYLNSEEIFRKIPDINTQVHHMIESNRSLCIAYSWGLYVITENSSQNFEGDLAIREVCQSATREDTVYGASNNCVFRFHYYSGKWHQGETIENIPGIHSYIKEDSNGNIFITGSYNKVYKISISNNRKTKIDVYDHTNGVPEDILGLFKIHDKIYLTSQEGILTYDNETRTFIQDDFLGGFFNNRMVHELVEDKDNVWVIEGRARNVYCINTEVESPKNFTPVLDGKHVRATTVYPEGNGIVWIGCRYQLIRCDMNGNEITKFTGPLQ